MGVIERVLRKWGYIRLGRYGLELTPDDRVVVLRPDQPVVCVPVPVPLAAAPVLVVAPPVAPPAVVEEDEWEWEIAVARARGYATDIKQRPLPGMPPVRMARQMPVARPIGGAPPPVPPRRFPRASLPPEPIEVLGDATIRTLAVPANDDDNTSPGLLAAPPVRRAASKRS